MNTLQVNYPVAPETVMDPVAQSWAIGIGVVGLVISLIIGGRMSVKYNTVLPLLFPIAGFFCSILEPIVCILGHCVHAVSGQLTLFETNGRPIPLHLSLAYALYFGPVWMALFKRAVDHGLTNNFLWKAYAGTAVFAVLFEILPVQYGLWMYYDRQALWLWKGTVPLFWAFCNPVNMWVSFALILKYRHLLTGVRSLLLIPLTQVGVYMGAMGAGFPYFNAANSTASQAMIELSGIASVLLGLGIVAACNQSLVASSKALRGTAT